MAIMKSNRCLFVQFIDDDHGVTLAAADTRNGGDRKNLDGARHLGRRAAETAIEKGIREVVVDRGGFRYHGCVKAIVEGALEGGLRSGSAAVEAKKPFAPAEEVS
jgi:large subunit ribosomal protein L18